MNIFIAGGSGFIGSHLIKELSSSEHNITILLRPNSKLNSKSSLNSNLIIKKLEQLTVSDLLGIDTVINLVSAGVSPKRASWGELEKVNINFAIKLLEYSQIAKVKRYIATGSCLEYGTEANNWELIHPDAPLRPISPYAASKAASFFLLNSFALNNPIELFYGRIFYAFGDGQYKNNFFPSLKDAANKGDNFKILEPDKILDFIPVEEVAKHLRIAVERNDIIPKKPLIVNIGTGKGVKLGDFAKSKWKDFKGKGKLILGEDREDKAIIGKLVANTINLNYLNP